VLGLWSLAQRLLAIPGLLFDSMWRVGFPAFSRLMQGDDDRDIGALLERTVGTFAVAASAILCPLVASSPALVPLLFGAAWSDVSLILPGAALALAIAGPIGMVSSSYFYARGDAGTGLRASLITGALRLCVALPLLPELGVVAIGLGWAAGAMGAMVLVLHRARRACGARLGRRVAGPVVSGAVGGAAGWIVADSLGVTVPSALLAVLLACALWTLLMLLFSRDTLRDGVAMGRTVLGSAFGRARARRRRTAQTALEWT
jgi:O-antigen/teichoic acid export membrane protein